MEATENEKSINEQMNNLLAEKDKLWVKFRDHFGGLIDRINPQCLQHYLGYNPPLYARYESIVGTFNGFKSTIEI